MVESTNEFLHVPLINDPQVNMKYTATIHQSFKIYWTNFGCIPLLECFRIRVRWRLVRGILHDSNGYSPLIASARGEDFLEDIFPLPCEWLIADICTAKCPIEWDDVNRMVGHINQTSPCVERWHKRWTPFAIFQTFWNTFHQLYAWNLKRKMNIRMKEYTEIAYLQRFEQTFGSARSRRLGSSRSFNCISGNASTSTISTQIIEIGMNDGFQHIRGSLKWFLFVNFLSCGFERWPKMYNTWVCPSPDCDPTNQSRHLQMSERPFSVPPPEMQFTNDLTHNWLSFECYFIKASSKKSITRVHDTYRRHTLSSLCIWFIATVGARVRKTHFRLHFHLHESIWAPVPRKN